MVDDFFDFHVGFFLLCLVGVVVVSCVVFSVVEECVLLVVGDCVFVFCFSSEFVVFVELLEGFSYFVHLGVFWWVEDVHEDECALYFDVYFLFFSDVVDELYDVFFVFVVHE